MINRDVTHEVDERKGPVFINDQVKFDRVRFLPYE